MRQSHLFKGRILVWFSCGAASAVAAKLAAEKYQAEETEFLYCDLSSNEHPDNIRFRRDVQEWIGREIITVRSTHFRDIYHVFEKTGYIAGIHGAACTRALKRDVRKAYQRPEDVHVFGFTSDEAGRIADFERDNPELELDWLLRDAGVTKADCYRRLSAARIPLPVMYRLGYRNNNCIGCVKGGAGYWNKIRKDFPPAFERMAKLSREMGVRLVSHKGERVFLDELPPTAGRYLSEPDFECGPQCVAPNALAVDPLPCLSVTTQTEPR